MKIVILLISLILLSRYALAQGSFKPWDADVAVGDETVVHPVAGCPAGEIGTCRTGAPGAARGVYDSFTGGALLLIRVFQIWISPLDGPSCRFRPTCSAYGKIAVQKHGAFLGGVLAGDRILRCNPFTKPGDDPVPERIFDR
jgi:putative membrane protein insertion efficiency factor